MRPHRFAIGLSITALTAASLSLPAAQAAPAPHAPTAAATAAVPSGKALVRIDGGTAYAKKIARNKYRLAVPAGASIQWYGEAEGQGARIGTFTQDGLVKGWQRLGHRPSVGVLAGLTWQSAGESTPTGILARVWNPRVGKDGLLVFTARAEHSQQPIPTKLPGFSINILRAQTNPRAYPLYMGTTAISDTVYVGASAGADTSATVALGMPTAAWVTINDPVNWTNCPSTGSGGQPQNPLAMSGSKQYAYNWGPYTCGDVSFGEYFGEAHTNFTWIAPDPYHPYVLPGISMYFSIKDRFGGYFPYFIQVAEWNLGGSGPKPVAPPPPS